LRQKIPPSAGTNYTVSITLYWFDEYRKAWKTGLIKGFKWSIRNDTPSTISGIGIVSDNTRPFCQKEYKDGDACIVLVAARKIKSVTGIIGSEVAKQVEFQIQIVPTEIGQRLFNRTPRVEV
jgi:hypothetical protein